MTILTPHNDPYFFETLHNPWNYLNYNPSLNMVVDHETGLLKPMQGKQLAEYVYGGEYDLVCGNDDDDLENSTTNA